MTVAVFAMGMLFVNWQQPQQVTQAQPADKTAEGSIQKEEQKTFWQKVTADPVATFTLCLVVIAAAQAAFFVVQLTYMRTGMDDAREVAKAAVISAKAAKISAEHIPNVERAYIFFASATCDALDNPKGTFVPVKYSYKNSGRTPAIVNRIQVGLEYLENEPSDSKFTYGDGWLPTTFVLGGDKTSPENEIMLFITGVDYEKAKIETGRIFFWCKVTYLDVFGASHEAGLCSEWHFGQSRFVITQGNELNRNN